MFILPVQLTTSKIGNLTRLMLTLATVVVVVDDDSHIQRTVLATEETTVTQQVSHRPIKRQSRSWSQNTKKVNGSHHNDNPLLRPTGIQITTKSLPGPTNREHRKRIYVMIIYTYNAFGCMVAIRGGYHMARGWRYTVLFLSFLFRFCFVFVSFLFLF